MTVVAEQVLGHRTFIQNLRAELQRSPDFEFRWLDVDFTDLGLAARTPGIRHHMAMRGSIQALEQVWRIGLPADVLVFHTQTIAQLAWPLTRLIPTVISLDATQENYDSLAQAYGHSARGNSLADRAVRRLNRAIFRSARALLPWSAWTARSLIADYGVDPAKVVITPPGVDLVRWRPPDRRAEAAPVKVLFVGGDFERKGGRLLLDALRTIEAPWELHAVTGADVPSSEKLHVYRGLTNNSAELIALYHRCDLLALPTFGDFLPMVLIEGIASGLPVISTTVGGIPDVVRDGENGFLTPPGDVAALRARLLTLLTDAALRRRMGRAARRLAEEKFDAAVHADTVSRILRSVSAAKQCGQPPGAGTRGAGTCL